MTLAIVLMAISLFGLAILFYHKLSEMHREAPIISGTLRSKADGLVSSQKSALIRVANSLNRKNFMRMLVPITILFIRISRAVEAFFRRKLKKMIDMIHGKGSLKNKGSASFFLRDISEHKNALKKQ